MNNLFFLLFTTLLFTNPLSAQALKTSKETKKTHQNSTEQKSEINQIDSLMTKSYERGLFNGNVLIAKNNKIIYQKSFGFTDETKQTKLNNKSIFNIGSIAKEFNAVAIMILFERGLLNLDDPISKYNLGLPKWSEKVTTRHLINYASGIPKIENKLIVPKNDEEAWKILRNSDTLLFEPGTNYMYDNGNVFLQRRIIEKVTGMTFQQFVIKNIVNPLKMTNSVFDPTFGSKNRTSCYDMDNVRCPELKFISGWLWVDINDFYKWTEAMNTNHLISKESFQTLLNNPYAKEEGGSLGRYFEKEDLQRHNGVSYKFESIFLNDFKNKITIILVSNNLNRVWDLGHIIHNLMLGKEYEIPKKSVYQALRKESLYDVNKAIKTYYLLKKNSEKEYSFENPGELNKLGYELLRLGKTNESITIFKLATKEFPTNANLFDSLGEAYFTGKQYSLALESYKKAISLGGTSGHAEKMIDKIEKEIGK
ncbi:MULTISPECIES: serine hydrolase domain-containing protein [Chryseobacterium]|uniref:serine hydrolase domain-containing protein n=1 Tax=Chryseobacterium TaxID=59732 RepID=UPI000F98734C|nr:MULTISPECIES: serine hydrolase domain-containing protein [Chryseobacterium]MBM7419488.1 CubicO group peptidase (beta-lactamase class C family) [Chryseobacterium sp. JUb44]MDH6209416.1 CubicO group peptidase (beta-lactamase class C family) [Chryseobacterium sp. BIGb0186]WSO12251.1 serine hydrolase [Chryseobacterium scophthalmum]